MIPVQEEVVLDKDNLVEAGDADAADMIIEEFGAEVVDDDETARP